MNKYRFFLISLILILSPHVLVKAQDVPAIVSYCDVEIKLSPDAQTRIKEYYRQIIASPRYFNEMVKRAEMYLPFVEEAFGELEVPHDLKYLSIQESALRADVVSSSKAVGFWQLDEDQAAKLNLQVDNDVDERMHIYRSSRAAAIYLKEANRGYSNWVYAMLSFYEGATGSAPYTNPDYYGEKAMNISANDHWYILKAIANKLAYDKALTNNERPDIYLMPFVAKGGATINSILEKHQLTEEEFLRYNKWVQSKKRISKKNDYTYYIARSGSTYIGHIPDPLKIQDNLKSDPLSSMVEGSPTVSQGIVQQEAPPESITIYPEEIPAHQSGSPAKANVTQSIAKPTPGNPSLFAPKAINISSKPSTQHVTFELRHDLHFGREYIAYTGYARIAELANRYKKELGAFLQYNGLNPGEEPTAGQIIYIEKPEKRNFHIVQSGESLIEIAADHMSSVARIQNRNRMSPDNFTIYVGQKLYLKDRKPKDEMLIILSNEPAQEISETAEVKADVTESKEEPEDIKVQEIAIADSVEAAKEELEEREVVSKTEVAGDVLTAVEEKELGESLTLEAPTKAEGMEVVKEGPLIDSISQEQKQGEENIETALPYLDTEYEGFKPVWVQHIVASGETLFQISQKYGTQVDLIKKINKLESDNILMGQFLRVLATKKFD